jgi:hypothetical protein
MTNFRRLVTGILGGTRKYRYSSIGFGGILRIIDTRHEINHERWRDVGHTTGSWNPTRAKNIAAIIPNGVHVLDLGAGSLVLKKYLKSDVAYTPSDLHDRGEGCIVVNLDKYEFPQGRYDWITIIGVVEYLKDPRWVLARAAQAAPNVIVTYNTTEDAPDLELRTGTGWISHLSRKELFSTLRQAGFIHIRAAMPPIDGEIILLCQSAEPSSSERPFDSN